MLDVVSFEVLDGDWKYCSESDIQPLITTLQLIKKMVFVRNTTARSCKRFQSYYVVNWLISREEENGVAPRFVRRRNHI